MLDLEREDEAGWTYWVATTECEGLLVGMRARQVVAWSDGLVEHTRWFSPDASGRVFTKRIVERAGPLRPVKLWVEVHESRPELVVTPEKTQVKLGERLGRVRVRLPEEATGEVRIVDRGTSAGVLVAKAPVLEGLAELDVGAVGRRRAHRDVPLEVIYGGGSGYASSSEVLRVKVIS